MKKKLFCLFYCNLTLGVFAQVPTINSFNPTSGPVGTSVTIAGTNFNSTPANNIVFFGATTATVLVASTTSLTVEVPLGATYNSISVTNIISGLTAYSQERFTPTFHCGGSINTNAFGSQVDSSGGFYPSDIDVADLDGDGKSDLVTVNTYSNTISVLRNTGVSGNISFDYKLSFATGNYPYRAAIGDLDGDGKPDVAVVNVNDNTVSILKNTSTVGAISFAVKVDFTSGFRPINLTTGDIDNDGKLDICVTNDGDNTASILRNTSTPGNISFASKIDFSTGTEPWSIASADLDGDGLVDLAVTNWMGSSISILRNTSTVGSISFAPKTDYPTGTYPSEVTIGDLDGDSKLDVVISSYSFSIVSVNRNTSTPGNISLAGNVDFATGNSPHGVALADLDGDGKVDIAAGNSAAYSVSVFSNTCTTGNISFSSKTDFLIGAQLNGVALADMDGDEKPDIITSCEGSGKLSVLHNEVNVGQIMTNPGSVTICSGGSFVIPLSSTMPSTYTWIATDNPNTTGESLTVQTTNTITNTITNSTTSIQIVTYTVIPTTISGNCIGLPQVITVTVCHPVIAFTPVNSTCYNSDGSLTALVSNGVSPYNYTWSNGGSTQTISNLLSGNYSVSVSDNIGCIATDSFFIGTSSFIPLPSICMVTVDSASVHNVIIWDKTVFAHIDSFIIYREVGVNDYKPIGAIPYDSLSLFVDTVRAKYFPNTGDPNAGTYRYKLGMKDSCGNVSTLSPYHNTIYIINNSGAFSWTQHYTIENAANPVTSYILMRDDLSNGNWHAINSVSGTQQNIIDPNYLTYQATGSWRVETQWNISCNPTIKNPEVESFNVSRSNIYSKVLGVQEYYNNPEVTIFPNPTSSDFTINGLGSKDDLCIYDVYGKMVFEKTIDHKQETVNPSLSKGMYFYKISGKGTIVATGKLIIQ